MLPGSFRLANLFYGHNGKYICSIKGRFDPKRMNEPIQLGRISCGCWIVLDGNNRIGLIIRHNVEAKIADFPERMFAYYKCKEYDEREIYYWNPFPKTFGFVLPLSRQLNTVIKNKREFTKESDYHKEVNRLMSLLTEKKHTCPKRIKMRSLTNRWS